MSSLSFNTGLNRVTIADLPGVPSELAGRMAHEWLATWSLAPRMRAEAGALVAAAGLPALPDGPPRSMREHGQRVGAWQAYPLALNAALEKGDAEAGRLADRLGMALAAVVASLVLAPPDSRAARSEWPAEHWDRWTQVRQLGLGGGLLESTLGQHLVATAREWLPRLGVTDVKLHLFSPARLLMLHGAARQYPDGPVLVLDAGHTALKRAVAEVQNAEVIRLDSAPLLPTPYHLEDGQDLLDFMTDALTQLQPSGRRVSQVALSLSVQLTLRGRVDPAAALSSFYGLLAGLPLSRALQESLSERLGHACTVRVMHEGQAAVAGMPDMDAVLLLGTSVGGGLNPKTAAAPLVSG